MAEKLKGSGLQINILGFKNLKSGKYSPSQEEITKLRQENPLLAAVYLAQDGKTAEAEQLVDETQRHLREEVQAITEKRFQTELAALQEQLKTVGHQRNLDKQELLKLRETLQRLTAPPFSRAILIETFTYPTLVDEEIKLLKTVITSIQALRPIIDQDVVERCLPTFEAKLTELEKQPHDESTKAAYDLSPTNIERENAIGHALRHRAIIAVGSGRHEVNINTEDSIPNVQSMRGREVWTAGDALTVVKIGQLYPTGVTAEVVRRLDYERLHVKGRADEEYIVQMTPELAAVEELEAGDLVRVLPQAELGIALIEKSTRRLTLDALPTESYNDIGGMDEQITQIRQAIELPFIYRTVYRRYALKRPKGILLYGPPGCGKTMVAKAIAKSLYDQTEKALKDLQIGLMVWLELPLASTISDLLERVNTRLSTNAQQPTTATLPTDLPLTDLATLENGRECVRMFLQQREINVDHAESELRRINSRLREGPGNYFLSIKGPELLSKWVGESESSIRRIFAAAREKASQETPVVLFFDEIESLFSRRGSGRSSDMEKTIVPQLLAEIDGVEALPNVLIIGASNRYDLIDPAVLRPGRLDIKIRIDRPQKPASYDIMRKYLTEVLPIDEREIQQFGNREQAINALISKALHVIYNPGSQVLIYRRTSKEGRAAMRDAPAQRKALTEIISGAALANIVERAKRSAAQREVSNIGTGINWIDDLRPAIKQEFEESKDQYIFEARSNYNEMTYLDVDLFEAEVILEEESKIGRPVTRWARTKARPWLAS